MMTGSSDPPITGSEMSGTTRTSADLDPRRRRILYRAWHRGMRETDLLLGRFADAEIADLSEEALADFETLLEAPDPDLFRWLTGETALPAQYDSAVFRRLVAFHRHDVPTHS